MCTYGVLSTSTYGVLSTSTQMCREGRTSKYFSKSFFEEKKLFFLILKSFFFKPKK